MKKKKKKEKMLIFALNELLVFVLLTRDPFFRYLLPALSHLSADDGPRKVLLTLETPALLVDFLSRSWDSLKGSSKVALVTAASMETACCALLNFTVTEPDQVRCAHAGAGILPAIFVCRRCDLVRIYSGFAACNVAAVLCCVGKTPVSEPWSPF